MSRKQVLAGVGLVVIVIGAVLVGRIYQQGQTGVEKGPTSNKDKGPVGAPIMIEVYSDFQCPACRVALPAIEALREKFPDKITVRFKHYPLEQNHKWAALAAQFAQCAAKQNKFWAFHDRAYEEQSVWSQADDALVFFARYSREIDLDIETLKPCLTDPNVLREIRDEREIGTKLGVRSTPSFFINSKLVVGGQQLSERGEQVVLEELVRLGINT